MSDQLREWRIGWAQGALRRAVHTLDRIDADWQTRPTTLRMLGLTKPGQCDAMTRVFDSQVLSCDLTWGHGGRHHDGLTSAHWTEAPHV